ncbi:uncharacterized protein KQ657_001193 [Scheffersomyces spartinae]|uniref:Mannosyltransferase n=1 Tax=Scheffersomyces spartinae TaxID=45513 RepID=A0A9P8AH90_9ASCO|nr:uncharacterized protein KQ657_001193 [Scheffersomyces spartinae]KAG7193076.1 hypothetical protein KQ657_001193 [Scheffersomyces spartinae]
MGIITENYLLFLAIIAVLGGVAFTKNGASLPEVLNFGRTKKLTSEEIARINKNRKFGEWTPDPNFKTPIPPSYANWDIEKTKPVPYRAFKHRYVVTMGIRSMDWDEWIQLDNEWLRYHELKKARVQEKGEALYATNPKARAAMWEFVDELKIYLSHRYPTLFTYYAEKDVMKIIPTGEVFHLSDRISQDPAYIAAMWLQDDIAIMVEDENGQYILMAGAIMLAGFWRLKDKYMMPLSQIHTSGDVPKYNLNLKSGMEKFFVRMGLDKPVVRNNYFIQTDENLPWSTSIGDEDTEQVGWYTAPAASDINRIYFRSERQSLRRLPKSGAIAFTIRTYFLPVTEMVKEPFIPRRLFDAISSWEPDVQEYRGLATFKDILLPYLEQKAKEQEDAGITVENEPQVFPF